MGTGGRALLSAITAGVPDVARVRPIGFEQPRYQIPQTLRLLAGDRELFVRLAWHDGSVVQGQTRDCRDPLVSR